MKWAVFILFFTALLADVYIYRSVICAYFKKLPARIAYIIFALITDGAALAVFLIYGFATGQSSGFMIAVMWIVWAFFLTALPKLLFAFGGFIDYIISLIARRSILIFRPIAIFLSVVGIAVMIFGSTRGRTKIKINEVEISSARVPEAFDGYQIVQFSDLHIGTMPNARQRIARIVDMINDLDGDLVVQTGDLVNISHEDLSPEIMAELSRINAPDGVWSVCGNHDLGFYIKDTVTLPPKVNLAKLCEKQRQMGWSVLINESVYICKGGDSILLSGVNYPEDGRLNGHNSTLSGGDVHKTFAGANNDIYNIALSHAPQMWRKITDTGFGDLTLSGHVHAMQLKLNLFGWSWSPAKYLYPEWSGVYIENKEKKHLLYINDGIGCVGYPMRIGASPELTLFKLKRCE